MPRTRLIPFLLAALAACDQVDDAPVPETHSPDRVPTDEEQRLEQERRAAYTRELTPERWSGWVADGSARFATPDLASEEPAEHLTLPEDRLEGILALADGRQFRQTLEAFGERPMNARPSELGGPDTAPRTQLGSDGRSLVGYNSYDDYPYRSVGTILTTQ